MNCDILILACFSTLSLCTNVFPVLFLMDLLCVFYSIIQVLTNIYILWNVHCYNVYYFLLIVNVVTKMYYYYNRSVYLAGSAITQYDNMNSVIRRTCDVARFLLPVMCKGVGQTYHSMLHKAAQSVNSHQR